MKEIIYLDNNATTPLDPRVLDAMLPFFKDVYANAASNHTFGQKALDAVNGAREQVAQLINCDTSEIVFTSGATEAINLAIKGIVGFNKEKKHIITVETEHSAVLDVCKYLEASGFSISYLPVSSDGLINTEELENTIKPDTLLVSVMYVNNETGVIQPIKRLADIAHKGGAYFMTDATQAIGKMPVDVKYLGIDLMAFSAHKFYGPKGVGALYVRSRGQFKTRLVPQTHGGGHENKMRSGTLNIPGIVGMGEACHIIKAEMKKNASNIRQLRDHLEQELLKIEETFVNGSITERLYNVTNVCFKNVDADAMIIALKNIMVSNGSACTSVSIQPSHVLNAMGLSDRDAFSSIRFSLSKFNTREEINVAKFTVKKAIKMLRGMSV